jgi:cell division protein FtsI (penicillin-binding protein 3)
MTLAAAIEEKKVTPETVITVPYALKRSTKVFHDHDKHPTQYLTTAGVLAVSSNTGSIQIGELISNDKFYEYLTKFGVGTKTGSGLPGESRGIHSLPCKLQVFLQLLPTTVFEFHPL